VGGRGAGADDDGGAAAAAGAAAGAAGGASNGGDTEVLRSDDAGDERSDSAREGSSANDRRHLRVAVGVAAVRVEVLTALCSSIARAVAAALAATSVTDGTRSSPAAAAAVSGMGLPDGASSADDPAECRAGVGSGTTVAAVPFVVAGTTNGRGGGGGGDGRVPPTAVSTPRRLPSVTSRCRMSASHVAVVWSLGAAAAAAVPVVVAAGAGAGADELLAPRLRVLSGGDRRGRGVGGTAKPSAVASSICGATPRRGAPMRNPMVASSSSTSDTTITCRSAFIARDATVPRTAVG